MSISSAMYTGLTGLSANGEAMGVLGDNIANLNTTGFKYSQVAFEDLMAQTVSTGSGPGQEGRGTRISEITPIFSQGSLETSADDVDVAISGTGFLIVREPTDSSEGKLYYTRDGNFSLNEEGYLVNSHGYRVQGYETVNGAPSGTPTDIVISQNYSPPAPTVNMEMVLNLDSRTTAGESYSTSLSVYDSLGNSHTVDMSFTKDLTAENTWNVSGVLDGDTANPIVITDAGTSGLPMVFTGGALTSGGDYNLALTSPPMSEASTVHLILGGTSGGSTTQYAASSVTNYASQDGYGPGYLQRVSIDNEGVITGNYSNGQITPLYQLTLARFNAPTKLHREGSNMYTETQDSGVPLTGTPVTNGLGSIASNSLEQSNVDLGEQFVHMILYQRAFQANSRVITTSDAMLEEVLSLKR